jgi:hypothetical protein
MLVCCITLLLYIQVAFFAPFCKLNNTGMHNSIPALRINLPENLHNFQFYGNKFLSFATIYSERENLVNNVKIIKYT